MNGPLVLVVATLAAARGIGLLRHAAAPTGAAGRPRRPAVGTGPVLAGAAAAAVVLAASGWVLPAIGAGMGVGWRVGRVRAETPAQAVERTEALATWVENLRDVLVAGDQPVGAVATTVGTCPDAVRPAVRRLALGLTREDPQRVLRRFADELDDPIGDLVAAGLLIAITRGARSVPVLSALAEQARAHSDRRRLIEAERAPTRREVDIVIGLVLALMAGLVAFGRSSHLAAYRTPEGQVFLGFVTVAFIGMVLRVRSLARYARPARFLGLRAAAETA